MKQLNIQLQQQATQLNEIVVRPHRTDFNRHYKTFKELFLGGTPNSRNCKIRNPDDLYLEYDTETKILKASASRPIEIENKALGYKVFYLLEEFELDNNKNQYRVFGVPRFESLEPKNDHQLNVWNRNRDKAYYGSINHFMRSLLSRELEQNHFTIYKISLRKESEVNEMALFDNTTSSQVHYKGDLKVVFDGEPEEFGYRQVSRYSNYQASSLRFLQDSITIYDNGYFENLKDVILDGYLAWNECVANWLPLGYQPTKKE